MLVADHGYAIPGEVLVCGDSHTCSAGVFNCAARGTGSPDMLYAAAKGETWFRVGETVRYELEGELPEDVSTKDVFLHIADKFGDHAPMNVEYGGPALANLSINARRTLSTMSAELSAEFATFEPDDVMLDYVRERNPGLEFEAQYSDADAAYAAVRIVDLSAIEPQVALPDSVLNNSQPVGAVAGTKIDQAFIGSCANGTLDDLAVAAKVLKGRRVADSVRLIVTPGSQNIYRDALRAGYIETLMDAGAVVTNSTCGACGGGNLGILAPGRPVSRRVPVTSRDGWARQTRASSWPRPLPLRPPPLKGRSPIRERCWRKERRHDTRTCRQGLEIRRQHQHRPDPSRACAVVHRRRADGLRI